MQTKKGSALVLIVLGLIVLAFPLLGIVPIALITGFLVLILGFGLLFGGIIELGESEGLESAGLGFSRNNIRYNSTGSRNWFHIQSKSIRYSSRIYSLFSRNIPNYRRYCWYDFKIR